MAGLTSCSSLFMGPGTMRVTTPTTMCIIQLSRTSSGTAASLPHKVRMKSGWERI